MVRPRSSALARLNNDLDGEAVERWMAERVTQNPERPVCRIICSRSPHVYWPPNDGYNRAERASAKVGGAQGLPDIDGKSFAGVLSGKTRTHRNEIYAVHLGNGDFNVYPCRAVRTTAFKYIRNLHPEFKYTTHMDLNRDADGRICFDSWVEQAKTDPRAATIVRRYHQRPAEELYDVVADPHETRNLAAEPNHADRLRELRGKLDAWMRQQNDTGSVFGKPRLLAEGAPSAGRR